MSYKKIEFFDGFESETEPSESALIGPQGERGEDGVDGLSAYEVAVSDGFEGTEAEWLESLKGREGLDGLGAIFGVSNPTNPENYQEGQVYIQIDDDNAVRKIYIIENDAWEVKADLYHMYGNLVVHGQIVAVNDTEVVIENSEGEIDFNITGCFAEIDLTGETSDVDITFANAMKGASYAIKITQGSDLVDVNFTNANIKWSSGISYESTKVDEAIDTVFFLFDGVNYLASWSGDY